jgi:hypothetical protein
METITKVTTKAPKALKAPKTVIKIVVPGNKPTAGGYLFAWTYACMRIIATLPKAKQYNVARVLHGSSALRHHGENGTRKMQLASDGSMQYDRGYFQIGAVSLDPKRQLVPLSWSECFMEYMKTGKIEKPQDGFTWKPVPKPLAIVEVSI